MSGHSPANRSTTRLSPTTKGATLPAQTHSHSHHMSTGQLVHNATMISMLLHTVLQVGVSVEVVWHVPQATRQLQVCSILPHNGPKEHSCWA